ncbi:lysophospholipase L2 [Xenorhabdus bovienii]|uniref:Lysophospholipase L(2) n=1 Tax=Xenorhabdus bovienii str. kraussei Becker Underwood TaxID=1398204 RepID=A0A077PQI1_XENBV|nr:lysophospholipase L2 [Xenorhabdus bovienii]MCG3470345.1 lysophospholipase L2 [Xenorhabdus bovienii]CDH23328.1 lysophospholipase L(2) [Xenorhabdus bovienii str. kraussei Becker Underwood]
MAPEILKASWLNREPQFSAFTNGLLLDFWKTRDEREFMGVDDIPIRYVSFRSLHHDKTLLILPGRSESYVKYPEIAYDFYHLGYDIFIIDHRGQGRSGRMLDDPQKGHVEKFDHYVDDLAKFVELEITPRQSHRCYALAHSMGAAILSRFLLRQELVRQEPDFRAVALCAPMFGINLPMPRWLANFLVNQAEPYPKRRNSYAVSTGQWRPLPYLINLLTHSYARYQRYLRYYADYPELRLGGPTYHWMRESMQMGDELIENAGVIQTPLIVLKASEDKVVNNRELLAFCESRQKARTGKAEKKPLVIQGAHHEILFEKDALRAQALNAICDFFDQH